MEAKQNKNGLNSWPHNEEQLQEMGWRNCKKRNGERKLLTALESAFPMAFKDEHRSLGARLHIK